VLLFTIEFTRYRPPRLYPGVAAVRRIAMIATVLAIAVCLAGDKLPLGQSPLLTGLDSCYAGGETPSYAGVLVPDAEFGTRIEGKGPVMWPTGYTAKLQADGQVAVLDGSGNLVATTGREYALAFAPHPQGEAGQVMDRVGAIAAPNCYDWDIVDCTASAEDPGPAEFGCPLVPLFDLGAVQARFTDECASPSLFEVETCEHIVIGQMRADGVYLYVRTIGMHRDPERAEVVCPQIASANLGRDGEALGFEHVTIEGKNNKRLAECGVGG
jgi:hypothetical protein